MKRLRLFSMALILQLFMQHYSAASEDKATFKVNSATITIHFKKRPAADTLDMYLWDVRNLMNYQQIYQQKISSNECSFKVAIIHPVYIGFEAEGLSLYNSDKSHYGKFGAIVEPGDKLNLEVGENLDLGIQNILFSGLGSEKYRLIQELITKVNGRKRKAPIFLSTDELFLQADADRLECARVMAKYKRRLSRTSYELIKLERINDAYSSGISRLLSSAKDARLLGKYQHRIFKLKHEFNRTSACYDISNYTLMNSLVKLEQVVKTGEVYDRDYYLAHPYSEYLLLKSAFTVNKQVCEAILSKFVASAIIRKGLSADKEKCALDFMRFADNAGTNYRQVERLLELYKNQLAAGNRAYEFALPDTNGNIVHQADFQGKVTVIDFFFNGCPGCITTAPYLDSLEKAYRNTPVAFISVSVDRTKQQWRKGIGTFSSKQSVQLFTEGKTTAHPIILHYRISTYPTIVLINRKGEILTARSPDPRTNDGWKAFRNIIDSELAK